MNETAFNIILIFVFILIGGVFAAAEMALVSLRGSQVKQLARRGRRGRLVARLHDNPNRFLSAVQLGVTLAGFLSAAFGWYHDRRCPGPRSARLARHQPRCRGHDRGCRSDRSHLVCVDRRG
jgi:hypothetical protein